MKGRALRIRPRSAKNVSASRKKYIGTLARTGALCLPTYIEICYIIMLALKLICEILNSKRTE
jgi:hypothetical protein